MGFVTIARTKTWVVMGLLWEFPILLPACISHHGPYTTPGLDPGIYFHEISKLWKVGNEEIFS